MQPSHDQPRSWDRRLTNVANQPRIVRRINPRGSNDRSTLADGAAMPPRKLAYYSPIMRRFAIPAIALAVAVALLALLAFGVAHQGTSSSIDAQVARGDYPAAPGARVQLPILGSSGHESLADLRGKVV